ncbi:MAG TPA: hypothetical protein G4O12_03235 [Dehalococcoidia bacterium]|nr:hypothetical protein [Dehalococcoidia bacterium]
MNSKVVKEINEIRDDRLHGAGWLSRQAINTLNLAIKEGQADTVADFINEIRMVAAELIKTRPSMISIANYTHQFLHQIILRSQKEKELDSIRDFALAKGNELIKFSEQAASKAAENAAAIISNLDTVITCSYSSTMCQAFELAKQKRTNFQVIIAESNSEGKTYGEITAEQLKQQGIPVEAIPDEDIKLDISKTTKALVGADSILVDGSLINGIPTHRLAQAATETKIPFYTVCETAKFDAQSHQGKQPKLEPGFDEIPPNLITAIITERGIIKPTQVINYIEEMASLL